MNTRIATFASTLLLAACLAGAARADCNCLYNGQRYEQEDTVCMRTPQGMRVARCGMIENNAWWQMLDQPCTGTVSELPRTQARPADAIDRSPTPPAGSTARPAAASSI
jgi:hypothetical protein